VCNDLAAPLNGRACIYQDSSSHNPDVIYYMHGLGDLNNPDLYFEAGRWGETNFYSEQIRQWWKANGHDAPTVISVSFGPAWILAPKNSSANSGLLEAFVQKVMPALEKNLGGVKGRRMILGESMGGFNTLEIALQSQDLFIKAAALCAPLAVSLTPYSTPAQIEAFITQSVAYSYWGPSRRAIMDQSVAELIKMTQLFFPSEAEWDAANPMNLAQSAEHARTPAKFYIAAGFYDPYALYEGDEKISQELNARGFEVQWRPQYGGHCAIDIQSLAQFLIE
jgi:S-formylglutathione hydrolase FrmB